MKWIMLLALIAAAPTTEPVQKRWIAKDGAPECVKGLAEAQPMLHAERFRKAQDEKSKLISALQSQIKEVKSRKVEMIVIGHSPAGQEVYGRDDKQAAENYAELKGLKQELEGLQGELKKLRNNDSDLIIPELWLNKGAIGLCHAAIVPTQIIDGNSFLATIAKQRVMVKGFDTDGMTDADRKEMHYKGVLWISGTTKYQNAAGSTTTCFVVEPVKVDQWIEYAVPATQPSP